MTFTVDEASFVAPSSGWNRLTNWILRDYNRETTGASFLHSTGIAAFATVARDRRKTRTDGAIAVLIGKACAKATAKMGHVTAISLIIVYSACVLTHQ